MATRKPILGIGINDADYPVYVTKNKKIDGKNFVLERWECRFYSTWRNMLQRCYSQSYQAKNQSYIGASVCDEWLIFSNFRKWMAEQDWENNHLDKDLLGNGFRYEPESCAFIPPAINYFMRDELLDKFKVGAMQGASFDKSRNKWIAAVGFKNRVNLGRFNTEIEAHQAWRAEKLKQAKILAERLQDKRIAKALIDRYS